MTGPDRERRTRRFSVDINVGSVGQDTPVFVISVAAQLAGMHPQTLRQYDRMGLVSPGRTAGRGRRYSARDIEALREVQRLSQEEGINLAGVKRIRELEDYARHLQDRVADLEDRLSAAQLLLGAAEARLASTSRRDLVPLRDAPLMPWNQLMTYQGPTDGR